MSWKPTFTVDGKPGCKNGQAFATREEAMASAAARFMVWTMPSAYDAEESDEPVNYVFSGGRDVRIPDPEPNDEPPVAA